MVMAMAESPRYSSSNKNPSFSSGKTAPVGHLQFVSEPLFHELRLELRGKRFLVACVAAADAKAPEPGDRLRGAIDVAVESALAMRGALPPSPCAQDALLPGIHDQLLRARLLGLQGLVLIFYSLSGFANGAGELSPSDAETLNAWLSVAEREPCVLLLPEADREVKLRVAVPLGKLVAPLLQAFEEAEPSPEPPISSDDSQNLSDLINAEAREAPAESDENDESDESDELLENSETQPIVIPEMPGPRPAPQPPILVEMDIHLDVLPLAAEAEAGAEEPKAPPEPPKAPQREAPKALETAQKSSAERILGAAERRAFAMELEAARGPKPMRTILELFMTRYTPLLSAVNQGEGDGFVRSAVDSFRSNFEHSYRESFASMRVTGKRPPMVFDAPELASKIARLNGARAVRLLLVDAMSFDLGERMNALLKERIGSHSICVDQALLWSALPSVTAQQLALLSRGVDGLREDPPAAGDEHEISRGRAVTTIRRERVGSREVLKLDCVEARIRAPGGDFGARMDAMAEELSQIVAKCLESQPPRTLVFVFGDHGFRVPALEGGAGTGAFTQGGASPEEVLVPGYAWLTGSIH